MEKYNKLKNKVVIMIILAIFMIISGGISSLIIGLKDDQDNTYKRVNVVKDNYEDFSTLVSLFEDYRDELYGNYLTNMTYDTMYVNNSNLVNSLSNYEAMVDEIYKYVKKIDKLCDNVYYPDSKANSICNNYKTIYEQVNNYFVSDIDSYNNSIESYNYYISGIDSNYVLNKYNTDKKYKDFDEDGKKVGVN